MQRQRATLIRKNIRAAKDVYPKLSREQLSILRELTATLGLALSKGEVLRIGSRWYVTHSGLLRIAQTRRCTSISTTLVRHLSEPLSRRWVFRAIVQKSGGGRFSGYGDADPTNVAELLRGSEMRIAETRAVNRALRKAYGVGICSIEEIGALGSPAQPRGETRELAQPRPVRASSNDGVRVRDRLCQIIRQHQLDATLVKSYATKFCGTKTLRDATREQVENFVAHLADWAQKDRNALLCQLNSYLGAKEGAA
jgi:hypothetical protein